jgi:hypothetical protein
MILLFCQASRAFDPYELPYGVYCTKDWFITDDISALDDTLGINFVYGLSDSNTAPTMSQAGYDVIKWGSADPYNPSRASDYSYFKVEAEDAASPIKFETRLGTVSGDFLVYSGQDTMLDNLWFRQYPTETYRGSNSRKTFYAQVRLAIDSTGVALGDTIGRILVHRQESDASWSVRGTIAILATQELLDGDTVEAPSNLIPFWLCELGSCIWSYKVKYSFWNSGATTVYLDYFKSYELTGLDIVEGSNLDDEIKAAVAGGWRDYVDNWWLRDEPQFDHFTTVGKVRSLVNDTTDGSNSITAYLLSSVRASFDTAQMSIGLRSFLQHTGQEKIVINDYPFNGGASSFFTDYTGYVDSVGGESGHRGLQKQLELYSCRFFDVVSQEIKTDTVLKEFWSSPQCFFQVCDSSEGYDPPNTMYRWRPLTRSEQRLNVYLPLCYHAKGLALWMYHWGFSADLWDPNCDPYSFGFYLSDTERNTAMWDVFANDITPYIKAIDSVYLGLDWQRAYVYKNQIFSPPSGAFISSIWAASIVGGLITESDPNVNPDRGWFQAGEFTISDTNDKYLMLVNRACSEGPYDSDEAPAITAIIRLNPVNLALGDHVYVIDIAKSTSYSGGQWSPIPETTYTTIMADGTIPFTTIFRAGEGRLFKIVKAE